MRPPRAVTRSTAYFRNWSEAAPFHFRSLGGKCEPISPSASAPRMASTSACRPTSPSEWARKPRRMRHADAADHQMIAVAEGVHVVAGAGPDIAEHGAEAGFFADEIFRCRQFHVGRIAFKGRYRQSRPFRERGIVGEIAAAVARGAAMGVEDDIEAKRLRRLRDPQPRALRRGLDIAGIADLLDRVGDGDRRNRGAGAAGGVDRARNHRRRDEGPRGVVDQNDVGLLARERLESGMHRGLARRAAIGRRRMAQAADGVVEHRGVVGIHHRLHGEHIWMAAKRLHRAEDHGLAADRAILFRSAGAGAKPAPGCDEDGCCTLGFGHWARLKDDSGLRQDVWLVGAQPLSCCMRKNRAIPNSCGKSSFCCTALAQLIELSKV